MAKSALVIQFFIILVLQLAVGCSNTNDLKQRRVVAVSNPQIKITRTTALTWYADFEIHSDIPSADKASYTALIKQQIENELIDKGFNFQLQETDSQYQVIALAVADKTQISSEYLSLFKLFPELSYDSDLSQGTLIVAIVDPLERTAAWRGTVQMFLEPKLEKSIRQQRISDSISKLLRNLKPEI